MAVCVPDILKVGLLTPVFKNKGNIAEVITYRGITVLPVINKIIETIIKNRTSRKILAIQNPIHRGFTEGSSSLNSALPVEETYRENADNKNECQLVLLDVKSAFDVAIQSSDETGIPCWNTGQTLVTNQQYAPEG